jgi:hypothetical protein
MFQEKKNFQTLQIPTSGLWCLEEYEPIIYTNTHQKILEGIFNVGSHRTSTSGNKT